MEVFQTNKEDIKKSDKIPQFSDEMLESIAEAEDIEKHPEKYKSYNSVEDLIKDLHNDM